MNAQHSQKTPFSEAIRGFGRNRPQVYRIIVAGALGPDWSDRLGGPWTEPLSEAVTDHPVTLRQGLTSDQSPSAQGLAAMRCNGIRTDYAFADPRRALSKHVGGEGLAIDCPLPGNTT